MKKIIKHSSNIIIIIFFYSVAFCPSETKLSLKNDWAAFKYLVLNQKNDSPEQKELRKNKLLELLKRHPEYKNNYIDTRNITTIALQNHDQDLFDLLLTSKVKYKAKVDDLSLPLIFTAAHYGNLPAFKKLLKRNPSSVQVVENIGHTTILHQILSANEDILELHVPNARECQKDLIKELLSTEGLEKIISSQDLSGKTPLHIMAYLGFNEELKYFLTKYNFLYQKYPNSLMLTDDRLYHVFDYAIATKNIDLIDFLINSNLRSTKNQDTLFSSHKEIISLIKNETKTIPQEDLNKLLIISTEKYLHLSLVDFLLNKGADINSIKNKAVGFDIFPLNLFFNALAYNDKNLLLALQKRGLNLNAPNFKKYTSLHYAAYYPIREGLNNGLKQELIKFLIENVNDINAQDISGNTALHLAIILQNFNFAKFLIKNGARCKIRNNDNQTPLEKLVNSIENKRDKINSDVYELIDLLINSEPYQYEEILKASNMCTNQSVKNYILRYFKH